MRPNWHISDLIEIDDAAMRLLKQPRLDIWWGRNGANLTFCISPAWFGTTESSHCRIQRFKRRLEFTAFKVDLL